MVNGIIESEDVLLYKDGASLGRVSMAKNDFPYKMRYKLTCFHFKNQ